MDIGNNKMYNQGTAKIVIIEDNEMVRVGYAYLINHTSPYKVVNAYHSFDAARHKIVKDAPDVVLLDIELPGTSGIEALPILKRLLPNTYVIILTVFETEKIILNALSNGASGYLTKNISSAKLIEAIQEVLQGGAPMSPDVAKIVITSLQKNHNSPLTKRETQILELIARGKDRSQIANELFIEIETVKTHIKNIYMKLEVNSKADALEVAKTYKLI